MSGRRLRELVRRAFATLRDEGFVATLDALGPYLGFRRLLLVEQPTDGRAELPALPAGYAFDEASPRDLDALAALRGAEHEREARAMGRPLVPVRDVHRERFAAGRRCFVLRHGGRIVATDWVARGAVGVDFLACELLLAPDEGHHDDAFVAPDLRGRGLVPSLYAAVAARMAAEGVARLVGLQRISNRASRRATAKAGFREAGSLTCLTLAGRSFHFGDARVAYRPSVRPPR